MDCLMCAVECRVCWPDEAAVCQHDCAAHSQVKEETCDQHCPVHATLVAKIETHMALHSPVSNIKSLLSPDVIHHPVVTWRTCVSVDQWPVPPVLSCCCIWKCRLKGSVMLINLIFGQLCYLVDFIELQRTISDRQGCYCPFSPRPN